MAEIIVIPTAPVNLRLASPAEIAIEENQAHAAAAVEDWRSRHGSESRMEDAERLDGLDALERLMDRFGDHTVERWVMNLMDVRHERRQQGEAR